jgi:sarcosine oxidase, subunit beta
MALTADVVIIGGGVTGTSIAFHLAARGMRDVLVVDKSSVASGGTEKSSACVRQHYTTAETCRMIRFSLDVFQRFEALTGGGSCGFRRTGFLLGVDERMRAPMEASVALQRGVGIETRLVSPAEMLLIEPRLRIESVGDIKPLIRPGRGRRGPAAGWLAPREPRGRHDRSAREAGHPR